jgi:sigma-B regulation protein RsbU (phosphoserine phosphatase)
VRLSIRTKLILAIGIPLMIVYLVVLVVDYRTGKANAIRHMEDRLTELTAHHAAVFDGRFSTLAQVAQDTASFLSTQPKPSEAQHYALLTRTVQSNPRVYGACIAYEPNAFQAGRQRFAPYACKDKQGVRTEDVSYDYTLWDWYLIPKLLQRPVWTDPYCDVGAGNIVMCTCSAPFERDGAFCGVATVDVSLADLRAEMAAVKIGGGYCAIVGQDGVFVSHPNEALIMRETMFSLAEWYQAPEYAELGKKMISGESGMMRIRDFRTSEPKWVVYAPIPSCHWSFAAVMPEKELLAPVYAELQRNSLLLLGEMGLVVLLILLTAIHITRPIGRLAKTVHEVAQGNLDIQATDIHTRDEIGEFAQAFNKMVRDLKAHVEALTRETAAREAVESEIRIARNIQTSLLPRTFPPFPNRKEFDLHAVNAAAKQVAGDFFDFYFITQDSLFITIADVSGKGVPAALFMAVTRTLLKNLAQSGLGPAEVLKRANALLVADNDESMFVTLFVGLYDTKTGRLQYANGGHNPPYLLDMQGNVLSVCKATGSIVGVIEGQDFGQEEIKIEVGNELVLYTDGVTEAHAEGGELFGEKRFEKLLSQHVGEKVERLCDIIVKTVNEYQKGNQYDDITLLVLRRNE